jgi:lipopolysaccharide/colanic/teichoic acid biosynthesis glycosyltransferase
MFSRFLNLSVSSFFLLLLFPLFLLISIILFVSSGLPIFFLQRRLGKDMREFKIIKFRTMLKGSESMYGGLITSIGDPRITSFGRFLREYSLDELPQLINVFKGDMNIVGPRPPVYYELGNICDFDENLKMRFTIKPGITGLSQVQGRNELEWKEKIKYDNFYLKKIREGRLSRVSIIFFILIKTIVVVIAKKGTYEIKR